MLERKDEGLSWWQGPTLIQALDQLPVPARPPATGPLRVAVSDLYKSGASVTVSGKVESGAISVGQKVLVLPSGEQTTVKGLASRNQAWKFELSKQHISCRWLDVFGRVVISARHSWVTCTDCGMARSCWNAWECLAK